VGQRVDSSVNTCIYLNEQESLVWAVLSIGCIYVESGNDSIFAALHTAVPLYLSELRFLLVSSRCTRQSVRSPFVIYSPLCIKT